MFALFDRETASSYTEELQALKGVEKELGRGRVYLFFCFWHSSKQLESCRIMGFLSTLVLGNNSDFFEKFDSL